MIEVDANDQVKICAFCVLPFTGFKTAKMVTAKPFHILDTKQRGRMNISAKVLGNSKG